MSEGLETQEDKDLARSRRTLLLMIGGALSLLIPLAGAVYLRMKDAPAAHTVSNTTLFGKRGDTIAPAATPAPSVNDMPLAQVPTTEARRGSPSPMQGGATSSSGGSLSMVRGGGEMYNQPKEAPPAAPPAATPAPAAPAPRSEPEPEPAPAPAKKGPKPFNMPKLRTTSNFKSFSTGSTAARPGMPPPGGAARPAAGGQQQPSQADMQQMMQALPPGTDMNALINSYKDKKK